jgi:hypothetical protein
LQASLNATASQATLNSSILLPAAVQVAPQQPEGEDPLFGLTDDVGGASAAVQAVVVEAVAEVVQRVSSSKDLWLFVCQFFGWWVCSMWTLVAGCSLAVHRLGLNSG